MIPYIIQQAITKEDIRDENIYTGTYICEDDNELEKSIINTIIEDMSEFLIDHGGDANFQIKSYDDFIEKYWQHYNPIIKGWYEIFNVRYFDYATKKWIKWDVDNYGNQQKIYNAYVSKFYNKF